jgi:hypothetical protein
VKARTARGLERGRQGQQTLSAKVKKPPLLRLSDLKAARRALRSARPARINCRRNARSLASGAHHDRAGRITAHAPSSRRGNRRVATGGHVCLPTPPTKRAAAAPEKARPRCVTIAATVGIKWLCPFPSKGDPRATRAPGSNKSDPRRVRTPTSGLKARSKQTGAIGSLDLWELLISSSRAGTAKDPRNLQMRKMGALRCYPARPY